jgi:hypothetical protein
MGSAQEELLACTCEWLLRGWAQGVGGLLTHREGLREWQDVCTHTG